MSELGTSISCLRADHAEMSSFWLALFTLLDYFIRQMFHKPDLSKISNFLWSTFSVEQIVFSQRKGHRTAVPFSVIFLAFFFFFTSSRPYPPLFFPPSFEPFSPSEQTQTSFSFILALPLPVCIFGEVFRLFQSKVDEDYLHWAVQENTASCHHICIIHRKYI